MPDVPARIGVPVWRAAIGAWSYGYSDDPGDFGNVCEPGLWFPEPVAVALLAVEDATRAFIDERDAKYDSPKKRAMRVALDALDAAQQEATDA